MPDDQRILDAASFLKANRGKAVLVKDQTRFSIVGYPCASKTARRVKDLLELLPIEGYKLRMNLPPGVTAYVFKEDFDKFN